MINKIKHSIERPFRMAVSKLDMAKVIVQCLFETDEQFDNSSDAWDREFILRVSRLPKNTLTEMRRLAGIICEYFIDRGQWPTDDELPERRQLRLYMVAARIMGYCKPCDHLMIQKWYGRNYRCVNCGTAIGRKR